MASSKPCDWINLEVLKQAALHSGDVLVVVLFNCLSESEQGIHDDLQWINVNSICLRVMDITAIMNDCTGQKTKVAQLISLLLLQFYDVAVIQKKCTSSSDKLKGFTLHAQRAYGLDVY